MSKSKTAKQPPADLESLLCRIVEAAELDPKDLNKVGCHLARKASDLAYQLDAAASAERVPDGEHNPYAVWETSDHGRQAWLARSTMMLLSGLAAGTPLTDDQRKRLALIRDGLAQCPAPASEAPKGHPSAPPGEQMTRHARKLRWESEAMALRLEHPDWPAAKIAVAVGRDKAQLSKSKVYRTATVLAQTRPAPSKPHANTRPGEIEVSSEDAES